MSLERLTQDVTDIKEDVAYIRGMLDEGRYGSRLSSLEKKWYGVPVSIVGTVVAAAIALLH